MSLRKGRASLLAGTALAGSVLSGLIPAISPVLVVVAASGAVAVPVVFLGATPARADNVGGSGGLGPSRNYGVSPGGAGGTSANPGGYTGTSGNTYNRSGGGGGGGAVGGAGGNGGASYGYSGRFLSYPSAPGGTGGTSPGANGSDGSQGTYSGGGGGGGAGGANAPSVGALSNTGVLTGQAGGKGGNGSYGSGFLNSGGGGGGGGAGAYGAVVTGGDASSNGGKGVITGGAGGDGGNGGSGGSTNNGGQAGNGGGGGIGVQFTTGAAGATFTNMGQVAGGAGGAGGTGGYRFGRGNGGNGGVGVQFDAVGSLINPGSIAGGVGGSGGNSGYGGAGGTGLSMTQGGTIDNSGGKISGGDGGSGNARDGAGGYGAGSGRGGSGGVGIIGSGLTITNAGGMISGGMSGDGTTQAYAIEFTGGMNAVGTGGTINGGINIAGGSFMPAIANSAVGTPLAVSGPVMFASGTSYDIRITPTASDSVAATGDVTLNNANLNINASSGTYSTKSTYVIMSGATVNGTFGAVKTNFNFAFLTPTFTYTGTEVDLSFTSNYKIAGGSQNQQAVGAALNSAAAQNGGSGPALAALQMATTQQGGAALTAISGNGLTGAQNAAFTSGALFTSSITDQTTGGGGTTNSITVTDGQPGFMAYAPTTDTPRTVIAPIHELADLPSMIPPPAPVAPSHTWHAWATGFGGAHDIDGNAAIGSAAQTSTIYGGTVGVDYRVSDNYLAGIALGGSNADFSVNGGTSGTVTGGHIAFYDLFTLGRFYATTTTSASFYSNTTNRFVSVGGSNETDRGNFDSREFRNSVEFGRHFTTAYGLVTPFVGLQIAELRSNGFRELPIAGAGNFALNVGGQTTASVPSFLGLRLQRVMSLGNGMTFSPVLQAAWVHEFSPQRNVVAGLVNLPGATFLATGASPASNAAQVKAGGELALNANSALFANFDGTFSGVDRLYAGKGGFRYVW